MGLLHGVQVVPNLTRITMKDLTNSFSDREPVVNLEQYEINLGSPSSGDSYLQEGESRMKFSEIVDQTREFLRQRERVSYRALKREFDLDKETENRRTGEPKTLPLSLKAPTGGRADSPATDFGGDQTAPPTRESQPTPPDYL